jgi:hypothetical protein
MTDRRIDVGQRFRKTDGTGMVFEIMEFVQCGNLPHVRVALVNNPSDRRMLAVAALFDRRHFAPDGDGSLPAEGSGGRLGLATT